MSVRYGGSGLRVCTEIEPLDNSETSSNFLDRLDFIIGLWPLVLPQALIYTFL